MWQHRAHKSLEVENRYRGSRRKAFSSLRASHRHIFNYSWERFWVKLSHFLCSLCCRCLGRCSYACHCILKGSSLLGPAFWKQLEFLSNNFFICVFCICMYLTNIQNTNKLSWPIKKKFADDQNFFVWFVFLGSGSASFGLRSIYRLNTCENTRWIYCPLWDSVHI